MNYKLLLLPIIITFQLILNIVIGIAWISPGNANTIPHGITVEGRNIGGFNPAQAVAFLKSINRTSVIDKELILQYGSDQWELKTSDYNFSYSHSDTINEVIAITRNNQSVELLKLQARPVNVSLKLSWDQDNFQSFLDSINEQIYFPAENAAVGYEKGRISIKDAKMGQQLDYEETMARILQHIRSDSTEPVNIATRNLMVQIGSKDLESINTILAFFATDLDNNANRTSNIIKAASLIDGSIIMPGKVFSFNDIVGERSEEKGFKAAPIIVKRKAVDGLGGGICQLATNIYNASIQAGLPVVERYPHSVNVKYVEPGRDATIVYGLMDLKVKNGFINPVGISTLVEDNQLIIRILGNEMDKK